MGFVYVYGRSDVTLIVAALREQAQRDRKAADECWAAKDKDRSSALHRSAQRAEDIAEDLCDATKLEVEADG